MAILGAETSVRFRDHDCIPSLETHISSGVREAWWCDHVSVKSFSLGL